MHCIANFLKEDTRYILQAGVYILKQFAASLFRWKINFHPDIHLKSQSEKGIVYFIGLLIIEWQFTLPVLACRIANNLQPDIFNFSQWFKKMLLPPANEISVWALQTYWKAWFYWQFISFLTNILNFKVVVLYVFFCFHCCVY